MDGTQPKRKFRSEERSSRAVPADSQHVSSSPQGLLMAKGSVVQIKDTVAIAVSPKRSSWVSEAETSCGFIALTFAEGRTQP